MHTIYEKKIQTITLKIKDKPADYGTASVPKDAVGIARNIYEKLDDDQEHLVALFLDARNNVRGFKVISSGGQGGSTGDPKIIFRNALMFGSSTIILVHNHPSMEKPNPSPSQEDKDITCRLVNSGRLLDLIILDHIIINQCGWFSFRNANLIKGR